MSLGTAVHHRYHGHCLHRTAVLYAANVASLRNGTDGQRVSLTVQLSSQWTCWFNFLSRRIATRLTAYRLIRVVSQTLEIFGEDRPTATGRRHIWCLVSTIPMPSSRLSTTRWKEFVQVYGWCTASLVCLSSHLYVHRFPRLFSRRDDFDVSSCTKLRMLDPIPTDLLKELVDIFRRYLMAMVNASFREGHLSASQKTVIPWAIITPLLNSLDANELKTLLGKTHFESIWNTRSSAF